MNINYNNHYISSILKAEQLLKLLHSISSRIIANSTEQNHRRKNVNRHSQRKNTHRLTKFSPHQEILYFPRDFLNRGVKPTLALGHGRLACPYVFTMVFTHTNLSDPIKRSVNWFGFPNADCELWRKKKGKSGYGTSGLVFSSSNVYAEGCCVSKWSKNAKRLFRWWFPEPFTKINRIRMGCAKPYSETARWKFVEKWLQIVIDQEFKWFFWGVDWLLRMIFQNTCIMYWITKWY